MGQICLTHNVDSHETEAAAKVADFITLILEREILRPLQAAENWAKLLALKPFIILHLHTWNVISFGDKSLSLLIVGSLAVVDDDDDDAKTLSREP